MSVIKPGTYTRETLPPLSPGAQRILEIVKRSAEARAKSPEGIAAKKRADEALKEGRRLDAFGILLGAKGYEKK